MPTSKHFSVEDFNVMKEVEKIYGSTTDKAPSKDYLDLYITRYVNPKMIEKINEVSEEEMLDMDPEALVDDGDVSANTDADLPGDDLDNTEIPDFDEEGLDEGPELGESVKPKVRFSNAVTAVCSAFLREADEEEDDDPLEGMDDGALDDTVEDAKDKSKDEPEEEVNPEVDDKGGNKTSIVIDLPGKFDEKDINITIKDNNEDVSDDTDQLATVEGTANFNTKSLDEAIKNLDKDMDNMLKENVAVNYGACKSINDVVNMFVGSEKIDESVNIKNTLGKFLYEDEDFSNVDVDKLVNKLNESAVVKISTPIAENYSWNIVTACKRIDNEAKKIAGIVDVDLLKEAYLISDNKNPSNIDGYKYPVCDVVNGNLMVIPEAVTKLNELFSNDILTGKMDAEMVTEARAKLKNYLFSIGETPIWESDVTQSEELKVIREGTELLKISMGLRSKGDNSARAIEALKEIHSGK